MSVRLLNIVTACLLSIAVSTNTYAALATADIIVNWDTLQLVTTGDLSVEVFQVDGDTGTAKAQGGLLDYGSISTIGGLDLSSVGPSSTASVLTTADSVDVSVDTTAGMSFARFERSVIFQAISGSGELSMSVDVELQAEVQGAASAADADLLFGYQVGDFGVQGSFASLELRGDSGDNTQNLATTLEFSAFMQQGDILDMFAEGEAEVSAVPIPAAAWLFGSGVLGLIGVARRKQAT
jgi:hypothetical protein